MLSMAMDRRGKTYFLNVRRNDDKTVSPDHPTTTFETVSRGKTILARSSVPRGVKASVTKTGRIRLVVSKGYRGAPIRLTYRVEWIASGVDWFDEGTGWKHRPLFTVGTTQATVKVKVVEAPPIIRSGTTRDLGNVMDPALTEPSNDPGAGWVLPVGLLALAGAGAGAAAVRKRRSTS